MAAGSGDAELLDAQCEEFCGSLYLGAFRKGERVLYVDAEVPNGAFDLRMAEQDLNGAQITCLLVNDGRLGSAQRMRPVILPAQPDPDDPFIDESSILAGADMIGLIGLIGPARKGEVIERASSTFKVSENAATGRLKELELNGPTGLRLSASMIPRRD